MATDTMSPTERRIHAQATFNALQHHPDANDPKDVTETAEALGVPEALVWLAADGVDVELIDALVAWWPRKEA